MKKGFTLIELLAVIVILVILSSIVIPSSFSMIKKAKTNSYNILVYSFEENARLYATRHREETENSLDANNYFTITLADLKEDGLLKTPITNPVTNEQINLTKKIFITRESDKTLIVCYEDNACYVPILLYNKITDASNVVSGTTPGLHYNSTTSTYYYRGLNPNNWVEFNDYMWRIVKTNSDDTIRLVFEGTKTTTGTTENGKLATTSAFNAANTNTYNSSSTVYTNLHSWYTTNILSKNYSKIQSTAWCIGKTTYSTTGTAKATFLNNECGTTTESLNIGLISANDYLYASLDSTCLTSYKTTSDYGYTCKNKNYLYKNSYNYWTITGDSTTSGVWGINLNGALGAPIAANTLSNVRPAITLTSNVMVSKGNGSFDKPYVLMDVVNVDKVKPTIAIIGDSTVNVEKGSPYSDLGATASDDVDGNITDSIITVSNINLSVVGSYTVTYTVSDSSGNKHSVSRIVNITPDTLYNASKGVNEPILASGMTPIKWSGSTWVNTTVYDTDWYDYTAKKWANAKTADGSMWVWIPRYIYKISSGWHTENVGVINIIFSKGIDDTIDGTMVLVNAGTSQDSNGTWTNHPAFTFGDIEVTGIWVSKFEASSNVPAATSGGGNDTALYVKSLPNVNSWRGINIGNAFIVS
ncbi:MAG: immunoglobulin-like domain-containing protein, partial [Bacilli bacterium]